MKHGNSDKKQGRMFTSYDGILGVLICDIHLSLPRPEAEVRPRSTVKLFEKNHVNNTFIAYYLMKKSTTEFTYLKFLQVS